MVPSKVFEYLSFGKPILSTYYVDNEASQKYVEKYPLGICLYQRQSVDLNVATFERKISQVMGKHIDFIEIKRLFPGNTPDVFKELIDSVR